MPTFNLYDAESEYIDDIGAADAHDALYKFNRGIEPDDESMKAEYAQLWQTYGEIADKIDPRAAQLIVAKTMAIMGSEAEWDAAGITEQIAEWLNVLAGKIGTPQVSDAPDSDAALRYWGSVG